MAHRDTDLDRITTLLGRCLDRIDEKVSRLPQEEGDQISIDALEDDAAQLQELVGDLILTSDRCEQADLNTTVDRVARGCIAELRVPVVVRQRLGTNLPLVACSRGQLTYAVQRALLLGFGHVDAGGEIVLVTRREGDSVVFEMECQGEGDLRRLLPRTTTLCDFVDGMQGLCRANVSDLGRLLLSIELPIAADDA